ncbi:hypothetical protein EDC04DRAFT_2733851 [Pisolithus marmoratus]|nr:hypothetical protein EDC04DRAFT_2733851 [Pisolithus marmoratus]
MKHINLTLTCLLSERSLTAKVTASALLCSGGRHCPLLSAIQTFNFCMPDSISGNINVGNMVATMRPHARARESAITTISKLRMMTTPKRGIAARVEKVR